jgi:hypothetical protein
MRFAPATLTVLAALAAALLVTGCGGGSGSSSNSTAPGGTPPKATAPNAPAGSKVASCDEDRMEIKGLRATAVGCATARTTMVRWVSSQACTIGDGSRSSCSLGGFRCQAVKVEKGASVSCAGPQGDVSFIATAWMVKKPAG